MARPADFLVCRFPLPLLIIFPFAVNDLHCQTIIQAPGPACHGFFRQTLIRPGSKRIIQCGRTLTLDNQLASSSTYYGLLPQDLAHGVPLSRLSWQTLWASLVYSIRL